MPLPLDDLPQLVDDCQSAADLFVAPLQVHLVTAEHNVDPDRVPDAANELVTRAEEHSNLVGIRKRGSSF
jgi:hypothetical protein